MLTLASRVLGVVRESLAARYFGAGIVSTAFTVAFTIPNLFRRLFGEGALSAAFIPLYSRSLKGDDEQEARRFASAAVKLLALILIGITIVGEAILWLTATLRPLAPDRLLTLKLTAIMLPYVLLVCGAAFLGAILQVHRRFGLTAASPILLNIALIGSTIAGARHWNTATESGRTSAIYLVSASVVLAGVAQILILLPALRAVGFRLNQRETIWTPKIRRMLRLSVPVALGAAVLQVSVLLDRGISYFLAQRLDAAGNLITHFNFLGHSIRYPMELGAVPRLWWAQTLYQFPLGVFAVAIATAIFPALSSDALEAGGDKFRAALRRGIQLTLWEGLPASVGLILVARPAVQLLFERGQFTPHDTELVTRSVIVYSIAIWAFGLGQILSRAFYALHDTTTPLVLSIVTLLVNTVIEIPLLWTGLGEAGMAAGTTVSFILQTVLMFFILQRKTGSLELPSLLPYIAKLVAATGIMVLVCWLIQMTPMYPSDHSKRTALIRMGVIVLAGGASYIASVGLLGAIQLRSLIRPRRAD